MNTKICSTCKEEKNVDQFTKDKSKKDELKINCSNCCKEYSKNYFKNNKEKEKLRGLKYDSEHRHIRRKWKNEYHKKNKETINNKRYNNRKENKDEYNKKLRNNIPKYIKHLIATSIRYHLKNNGFKKKSRTYQILGCSGQELKIYLESKFEPWMSWENYGNINGIISKELNISWDIDHIIPISAVSTEEEILKLNHFTNLQPMCSYTNRYIKSNKLINN